MHKIFASLTCGLFSSVLAAASGLQDPQAQKVTLLLEFSAKNSEANTLQMQHWNLVQQALGAAIDVSEEHVSLQRKLELVHQSGYCAINMMKTPQRLAELIFSDKPFNISPSLRLIRLGTHDQTQPVDLAEWLASSKKLKLGIAKGRSYGSMLDNLLLKHPYQIYQLSGEDVNTTLWQMLQKGRIDALVDYSVRIDYLNKMQPAPTLYSAVQIVGQPPILEGYLVCNPTEHGKQTVDFINKSLENQALQQALYQSYQQYFPPHEWQTVEALIRTKYPLAQPDPKP
jgi:uncharacterized protein (TIGR02285 family)